MKKLILVLLTVVFTTNLIIGQTITKSEKLNRDQNSSPGLMNITEIIAGLGLGDTDHDLAKQFVGLTSVLGYGITRNLNAGIGAGLSFYNGGTLVPLFLDIRYIINLGKVSVYAFGDGGLLFNFSESDDGNKFLLNPGLGIKYSLGNKTSANLGAGILMQTTKDKERDSFINLKLGITYIINYK
jgi:hypothetical protein